MRVSPSIPKFGRLGTRRSESGQSVIEMALILPLLLGLIVNVVNFGAFLYAWISVANGARAGADYMIMGGASATAPAAPAPGAVITFVRNDLSGLPNSASGVQVRVCKYDTAKPGADCTGTGTATVPTDPESAHYILGMVEVTYSYSPIIPLFGLPLTIGNTSVHRTAVMRMEG